MIVMITYKIIQICRERKRKIIIVAEETIGQTNNITTGRLASKVRHRYFYFFLGRGI
jgi:hypothetical protein